MIFDLNDLLYFVLFIGGVFGILILLLLFFVLCVVKEGLCDVKLLGL